MKDFVTITFNESITEEQNLRKVAQSLYFFLTKADEVQSNSSDIYIHYYIFKILNLFYSELKLINTKLVIKKN